MIIYRNKVAWSCATTIISCFELIVIVNVDKLYLPVLFHTDVVVESGGVTLSCCHKVVDSTQCKTFRCCGVEVVLCFVSLSCCT